MYMFVLLIAGLFGLIIGSFLNVLVLRRGGRALSGRSACMSCGGTLAWYDLIPVLSYLAYRGRCRRCGSRISPQYPLVEAATGIAFAGLADTGLSPLLLALSLLLAALLIAISAYDIRHTIIPDRWVYVAFFVALLYAYAAGDFWGGVLGAATASVPFAVLFFASRGRAMGLGDAKLALSVGALLGVEGAIAAVLFSFMLGGAVGAFLLFFSSSWFRAAVPTRFLGRGAKRYTMKSEVAFGPFLVAACFVVWFAELYKVPLPLFAFI